MVTLAQRIEALRTEANLSRPALAAALGFPKGSIEKFETGRQTPSKEQQEKLAAHFGVSLFYLRGESSDRTRQDDWMSAVGSPDEEPVFVPTPAPKPAKQPKHTEPQGPMLDALLASKPVQDLLRQIVLDTLRSPEGQELIRKALKK
ncbi:transcriptional regulator [Flavonifractor sp. An92]|uniref:helix-turn-helix domain-containing protein n=1 Tax=Flavonifractor sp. An92 TaxID=1965666 RepID=UPI000B373367|nr:MULTISPECIES: helix-turn-helix transcriptional regulator [unclassified Flavonifractor]OUN06908.1 transcriptional regulator [Flavonifractor sp. An92]OUQ26009.1 transcriptional regulator [Flavonifractor sp. An135]